MKKLAVFLFLFSFLGGMSQNYEDVLRLSHLNTSYGTARYTALSGAFGALGADFSTLSSNPAGLGMYRSFELTITPSLASRHDITRYLDYPFMDSRNRFLLDNFGLVTSFSTMKAEDEQKGLVTLNFGIGYNRVKDFYGEITTSAENSQFSILDYFAGLARDNHWYDMTDDSDDWNPYTDSYATWEAIMAWNTYLIDTVSGDPFDYYSMLFDGDGVYQDHAISSEGGIGEYTFSLGANFSNKVYLGATIGVQSVYLNRIVYYDEEAFDGNRAAAITFKSMSYTQNLKVEGSGVNLKMGLIYRPIPELRIGVAAHTPTFYKLEETYSAAMGARFNIAQYSAKTPINLYDYKIESPYRLMGSLAYTFGSIGLLSADYEYVDYSTMRFGKGGDGYRFNDENAEVKLKFTNAHNVRVGGEVWIEDFALRGGYAYYGAPFKSNVELSTSATTLFSAGFGMRMDNLLLDWAYQRVTSRDNFLPFGKLADYPDIIQHKMSKNRFIMTLSYKF